MPGTRAVTCDNPCDYCVSLNKHCGECEQKFDESKVPEEGDSGEDDSTEEEPENPKDSSDGEESCEVSDSEESGEESESGELVVPQEDFEEEDGGEPSHVDMDSYSGD